MSAEELVTSLDAAARLGLGRNAVTAWKNLYGLSPAGRRGRGYVYRWSDVLEAARQAKEKADATRFKPKPKPKPTPKPNSAKATEANLARERTRLALDLVDLAHMTGRGDVDQEMWLRVCRGRFAEWPPSHAAYKRTWERWKRRLRDKGIPMIVIDMDGGEVERRGQDSTPKLMRFDWPAVLRWTRRVLD